MVFQACLQFLYVFEYGWKDRAASSWVWLKSDTPRLKDEDVSKLSSRLLVAHAEVGENDQVLWETPWQERKTGLRDPKATEIS